MRLCAVHDEAALQARAALAPVYMTLRRMLMQLCGLLLLYRGSSAATRDGIATTLAALRQEHKDAANLLSELQAISAPGVENVAAAALYVLIVITQLELSLAVRGGGVERAESVLPLLQRAQRLLLKSSDDQAGLTMVGFSHCCCAASLSCY